MKRKLIALATGAAILTSPLLANAAPLSGIIEEGGPSGYYYSGTADHRFGDLSNSASTPVIEVGGDFMIYGSVIHRGAGTYKDGWTMDFTGGSYDLAFAWQNQLRTPLDFRFTFTSAGGTSTNGFAGGSLDFTGNGKSGLPTVGALTGLWRLVIDPIAGQNAPIETMNWQLAGEFTPTQVTTTAAPTPVPLPASALVLLAGLAGLGSLRRRKPAA